MESSINNSNTSIKKGLVQLLQINQHKLRCLAPFELELWIEMSSDEEKVTSLALVGW